MAENAKSVWKEIYTLADNLAINKERLKFIVEDVIGKRAETEEEANTVLSFLEAVDKKFKNRTITLDEAIKEAKGEYKGEAKEILGEPTDEEVEKMGEDVEKEMRVDRLGTIATLIYELNWSPHTLDGKVEKKYNNPLNKLSLVELDEVIASLEKETQKKTPQAHPTLDEVGDKEKEKKKVEEEKKVIDIEWDKIPAQVLVPKMQKALGLKCVLLEEEPEEVWEVQSDKSTYEVTQGSCTCEDWKRNGTSINPCKHLVRMSFSDEQIRAKLKEFGVAENELAVKPKGGDKKLSLFDDGTVPTIIQGMVPAMAEIGKIRIGKKEKRIYQAGPKKGQEYTVPVKLDHFELFTLEKDGEGWGMPDIEMNKAIGEDIKSLEIYLCYDDPTMNMPTFFSYFTRSKLVCMGNGQTARRTMEDGTKKDIDCNPKECAVYKEKKCKPYGRLSVILAKSDRVGGTYVFRSTSWNSLRNILSSMQFIKTVTGGILAGVPLSMTLLPMTVMPKDVGHNVRIYVVNIEYPGPMDGLKRAAADEVQRRIQMGMNMKQMEDVARDSVKTHVIEEAEQEAADIGEEFSEPEEG